MTYDDFVAAWYPDKGFGIEGRGPLLARNVDDDAEILAISFVDLPDRAAVQAAMTRIAQQESVRHGRIGEVVESTAVRGIYEIVDEFDFSTDATVEAGRPPSARDRS
jgi:hypothetical protein